MNSGVLKALLVSLAARPRGSSLLWLLHCFCAREPWNHWFPHVQALSSRNDEPEKASRPWDKA